MQLDAFEIAQYEAAGVGPVLRRLVDDWTAAAAEDLEAAVAVSAELDPTVATAADHVLGLARPVFESLARQPATTAWATVVLRAAVGAPTSAVDGTPLPPDPNYVRVLADSVAEPREVAPRVHSTDRWLRLPFGRSVEYEDDEAERARPSGIRGVPSRRSMGCVCLRRAPRAVPRRCAHPGPCGSRPGRLVQRRLGTWRSLRVRSKRRRLASRTRTGRLTRP